MRRCKANVLNKEIKICIVDYGMSNLKSVENAIEKSSNFKAYIGNTPKDIEKSDIIILPGVGAFDDAMANIKEKDLFHCLNHEVLRNKKPVLAICLGMQIIMESSEESVDNIKGFGWIPGKVLKLSGSEGYRVPHLGWDNISIKREHEIFSDIGDNPDFYFLHSYHVDCDQRYVVATCNYGYEFPVAITKDNISAFQFHPEKSHSNGLHLLSNYLKNTKKKL